MVKLFLVLLVAWLLSACAAGPIGPNHYEFQITSTPSGALVYTENGQELGRTPYRGVLRFSPATITADEVITKFILIWPSGVRHEGLAKWYPKRSKVWSFGLARPTSAPNLDVDLRVEAALKNQRQDEEKNENREILRAILGGLAAGMNRSNSASTFSLPPTRPSTPIPSNVSEPMRKIEDSFHASDPITQRMFDGTTDSLGNTTLREKYNPGGPSYKGTLDQSGSGTLRDDKGNEIRVKP